LNEVKFDTLAFDEIAAVMARVTSQQTSRGKLIKASITSGILFERTNGNRQILSTHLTFAEDYQRAFATCN
jgi:hypothetical protein